MQLPMRKQEPTPLDREIDATYARMKIVGPSDEEYPQLLKHIQKLEKLRTQTKSKKFRPSADTVLVVMGNLLGILIVVNYERIHVWSTRSRDVVQPLPKL